MWSYRVAIGCIIIAALMAGVTHPRIFWGNGSGSFVNLDGLFYLGQWGAFLLTVAALVLCGLSVRNGPVSRSVVVLSVFAFSLLVFLLATGIPHPANSGEWRKRELGLKAFMRGVAKRREENREPTQLTAESFAGKWRARDSTIFSFTAERVSWSGPAGSGEYSREKCAGAFELQYIEHKREVLNDMGLAWSEHAVAVYEAAAPDVRVPVAYAGCASAEKLMFIRAQDNEVWLWTASLDLEAIKNDSFVLRRVEVP